MCCLRPPLQGCATYNVSERRNCNGETLVRGYTYVGRGRRPSETIIAPGFIPGKPTSSDIRVRFRAQARNRTRMGSGSRSGCFSDPGMNPGAMIGIARPSAAGSHKFFAHPPTGQVALLKRRLIYFRGRIFAICGRWSADTEGSFLSNTFSPRRRPGKGMCAFSFLSGRRHVWGRAVFTGTGRFAGVCHVSTNSNPRCECARVAV